MKFIGLTGGIGMGKSTAAAWLRQYAVPVADSDQIARQVVAPGQPALAEIRAAFGPEFVDASGRLNREALGRRVFSDARARQELEAIMHPRIRAIWQAASQSWRQAGYSLGVAIIPLLYETAAETQFDAVVCVACSVAAQRARLAERGWSESEIENRNRAQWPIEQKITQANYVVWNEGVERVLADQMRIIFWPWLDSSNTG